MLLTCLFRGLFEPTREVRSTDKASRFWITILIHSPGDIYLPEDDPWGDELGLLKSHHAVVNAASNAENCLPFIGEVCSRLYSWFFSRLASSGAT